MKDSLSFDTEKHLFFHFYLFEIMNSTILFQIYALSSSIQNNLRSIHRHKKNVEENRKRKLIDSKM